MPQPYCWNGFLIIPEDLLKFAWSAPMRDLAARVGLSGVGLKKLLASYGVVPPPQGYWNKLRAGKPVPSRPKAAERRPGETGRLRIDQRFAGLIPVAGPISSSGPFATRHVPEDVAELQAIELARIGRVAVPKSLDRAHRALMPLLRQEAKRREKDRASVRNWDKPKFDNPLARRRLRILNALFNALSKRGHDGRLEDRDGELEAWAVVGDTHVAISLKVRGRHRTVMVQGYSRAAPDLPAGTPLVLRLDPDVHGNSDVSLQDRPEGTLESKLGEAAAAIIVAAEAKFRSGLRQEEARRERQLVEAEERRRAALEQLNEKRLQNLLESGVLLSQAQRIRAVVAELGEAIRDRDEIESRDVQAWRDWALAEADKLDPILSGQIFTHLRPPTLQSRE